MGIVSLGWDQPLGQGGSGGWNWWTLAGFFAVLLILITSRRPPRLPVTIAFAALGGLLLGDLTQAWGVAPVWGVLLIVLLTRNGLRRRRHPQV